MDNMKYCYCFGLLCLESCFSATFREILLPSSEKVCSFVSCYIFRKPLKCLKVSFWRGMGGGTALVILLSIVSFCDRFGWLPSSCALLLNLPEILIINAFLRIITKQN